MSVAGTWNLTIATPLGMQQVRLELAEGGGTVSGVATWNGETAAIDGIASDGSRLSWEQQVTRPFPVTVSFDLRVDGDSISGTAKAGMFPASMVTGSRA